MLGVQVNLGGKAEKVRYCERDKRREEETLIQQRWSGWSVTETAIGSAWGDTGNGPRGQEVTRRGSSVNRRIKDSPEETDAVAWRRFTPPQETPVFISSGMCLGFQDISPLLPPASPGGHFL